MRKREEDLLHELGRAGREGLDVSADRRWDALSAGELSEEDAAALEALAKGSEEGRAAYEAFRPIDEAARAKMAAAALAEAGVTVKREGESAPAKDGPAHDTPANDAHAKAAVTPLRSRLGLVGAVAAALAAAAAWAVVGPGAAPGLPAYSMKMTGEREQRADPPPAGDVARLGPGARLTLVLRPDRAVKEPIAARGFVSRGAGWEPWRVPMQIAPDGAVRIAGAREELFPGAAAGTLTIAVAVGRAADLPADPDAASRSVRVLRARVELHDGGSP